MLGVVLSDVECVGISLSCSPDGWCRIPVDDDVVQLSSVCCGLSGMKKAGEKMGRPQRG